LVAFAIVPPDPKGLQLHAKAAVEVSLREKGTLAIRHGWANPHVGEFLLGAG
jgi:hypothetical protein